MDSLDDIQLVYEPNLQAGTISEHHELNGLNEERAVTNTMTSEAPASYSEASYPFPNITWLQESQQQNKDIAPKRKLQDKNKIWWRFFLPTRSAYRGQLLLFLGIVTVTMILATATLIYHKQLDNVLQINSGLLLGSSGTIVMCLSIIGSNIFVQRRTKRHLNTLLSNLAVFDFLIATSFILEPVWNHFDLGVELHQNCYHLSLIREYLMMCSTAWSISMALDLYYLMTDPFTSPRVNRRKYQFISHSLASISVVVLAAFHDLDATVAVGEFCWIGSVHGWPHDSPSMVLISVFIIVPKLTAILSNLYVSFVSYSRFRNGIAATIQNRQDLLREGSLTTIVLVIYLCFTWSAYGAYWIVHTNDLKLWFSRSFSFMLSYRGVVPFILWSKCNQPTKKKRRKPLVANKRASASDDTQDTLSPPGGHNSTIEQQIFESTADARDEDIDDEDDSRPQLNVALLKELVFYTTQGIVQAVRLTSSSEKPIGISTQQQSTQSGEIYGTQSASNFFSNTYVTDASHNFILRPSPLASSSSRCKFTAFHPVEFRKIRELFNIHDNEFISSLFTCTTPKVSEGASGSFMFSSYDRSYIVKSLSHRESNFLHQILPSYIQYMTCNPASFLTRFLGSYSINLYESRKVFFAVMENIFDVQHGVSIHQRYDIKGSWIDRNAGKEKRGAETTCRHCNMMYCSGVGRNICPNRAGRHEPNVVLKDMDLTTKLRFGNEEGPRIVKQLKQDSDYLCDQGIMDYSLLLGVIDVSYQVSHQNILTRDGTPFLNTRSAAESSRDAKSTSRVKQSQMCLHMSEVVVGPGFYYIGVIDILQTWNFEKRLERFVKSVILRKDADGISAIQPKAYRNRFHKKLDEIIHLGHIGAINNGKTFEGDHDTSGQKSADVRAPVNAFVGRPTDIIDTAIISTEAIE
uniref:Phosphatidylinositol4phosphate5kinase (PIPKD6/GPCRPIPK) putative n=1 Tax=Albugo laibachii Nc14 TaxID=890382 RepID=F0W1T3_9STRA|nr:phosphatidylinositol4phosphate5kinase (PIPKD6/GPCRPIPK) putative [Albugo laibachii Nc14]|eukprot:CCA15012.1 phosphatidylinositol4phosphate5kinase (PIPKD6/GPCRPIPK) putative [Albugo laibachii Nc14]